MHEFSRNPDRNPLHPLRTSEHDSDSLRIALVSLLESVSGPLSSNGDMATAEKWMKYVGGTGPAPVATDASETPPLTGQRLAAFIRNAWRTVSAKDAARHHEVRTALGESVRSLTDLVEACDVARRQIYEVANGLTSPTEHASSSITSESAQLDEIQAIARRLGERASAKRRALNETLAALRMELLDLPEEARYLYNVVVTQPYLEELVRRYVFAGRQLGETVTLLAIRIDESCPQTVCDQVAHMVRGCFQRDIDLVARLTPNDVLVVLIDTPDRSVLALRRQLAATVSACASIHEHLESVSISLPMSDLAESDAEASRCSVKLEPLNELLIDSELADSGHQPTSDNDGKQS